MVRNYKKKKGCIDEDSMAAAISEVLKKKKSIRGTAIKYQLNHNTLFKRVKFVKNAKPALREEDSGNESENEIRMCANLMRQKHKQVFSNEEELELKHYLLRSSKINYGLTYVQTRNLAYQYAKLLQKKYPGSWVVHEAAGKDWMSGYMKRHPQLSLRKPENTSLARATAFNATSVKEFFNNYVDVMDRFKFAPCNVYNLDETGITTVMQAPKVIIKNP